MRARMKLGDRQNRIIVFAYSLSGLMVFLLLRCSTKIKLPLAIDDALLLPQQQVANDTGAAFVEVTDNKKDKEPILSILRKAGITDSIDKSTMGRLPTWTQTTNLYGSQPIIYGLESCSAFQTQIDPAERFLGVAGTFNTGTNLLFELLARNCHMPKHEEKNSPAIQWQVPWGKHEPVNDEQFRLKRKTDNHRINATNVLPVVTIKDPYTWMQSMCRRHYNAVWPHDPPESPNKHCPNLIPSEADLHKFPELQGDKLVPVRVDYANGRRRHYASLVHVWNEWYNEYVDGSFPRVMIRFEDLVFHTEEVITTVCRCAGGEPKSNKFEYSVKSTKEAETSLVDYIIRYGKDTYRLNSMTLEDLEFARKSLDPKLMQLFRYNVSTVVPGN